MFEIPQYMVDIAQIASAGIIAGALFYAAREYRSKNISEELNRSYYVLKDLTELEESLVEHDEKYSMEYAMNQWYERYFNIWEWFSYMINKRQIRNRELKIFFKKHALTTYERFFKKRYTKEEIEKDPELYPEFQKLCKDLEKLS